MTLWTLPFFVLAVAGLILSLLAHCMAILGLPQPLGRATWGLHFGVFVVVVPAILAAKRLGVDPENEDLKVAMKG